MAESRTAYEESWSGHALNVTGNQKAFLVLRQTALDGRINVPVDGPGSIRLWMAPHWTSANLGGGGPGNVAVVWELGSWSKSQTAGWWSLSIDPAGNTLNFAGVVNGQPTVLLSAPISWASAEWHQVTLGWDPQGQTQLFVDGAVAGQGSGMTLTPLSNGGGTAAFSLGSDLSGTQRFHGLLEEVYTFGRALTLAEVDKDFERQLELALLGPVSEAEEEAMLAVAAQNALSSPIQMMSGMSQFAAGALNYGCKLWLELGKPTLQGKLPLIIHNTQEGFVYTVWCKSGANDPTWDDVETLPGQAGADFTACELDIGNLDQLIFRVSYELTVDVNIDADRSFSALDYEVSRSDPPDTMGAIGPNHFVEILNYVDYTTTMATVAIYDKQTGQQGWIETNSLATLFGQDSTHFIGDVRIIFDHHSGTWLACALDHDIDSIVIAVKNNPDPTGLDTWEHFEVETETTFDYVTLGYDIQGIYLTWIHKSGLGGINIDKHSIVALKKPDLFEPGYQIPTPIEIDSGSTGLMVRTIQPAINYDFDSVNGYVWLVGKGPHDHANSKGGAIYFRRLQWDEEDILLVDDMGWQQVADSNPTYRDYFDLEDDNGAFNAPQNGGSLKIDLNGPSNYIHGRLMNAVIREGNLWTCHTIGLDGADGDYNFSTTPQGLRTGIQWFKLSTSSGELVYSDHGRFYDDSSTNPEFYYVPSISVTCRGDLFIGCSGSSNARFIGAFCFWRLADGSSSQTPLLLKEGEVYVPLSRWGDYSFTSWTSTEPHSVWTIQQYAKTGPSWLPYNWGTRVSKLDIFP